MGSYIRIARYPRRALSLQQLSFLLFLRVKLQLTEILGIIIFNCKTKRDYKIVTYLYPTVFGSEENASEVEGFPFSGLYPAPTNSRVIPLKNTKLCLVWQSFYGNTTCFVKHSQQSPRMESLDILNKRKLSLWVKAKVQRNNTTVDSLCFSLDAICALPE